MSYVDIKPAAISFAAVFFAILGRFDIDQFAITQKCVLKIGAVRLRSETGESK